MTRRGKQMITSGAAMVVLAITLATASATVGPRISDGRSLYALTSAIAEHMSASIPAPLGVPAHLHNLPPGVFYSKYGIGQSLLALPNYLVGRAVGRALGPAWVAAAIQQVGALFNPIVLALLTALLATTSLEMGLPAWAAATLSIATVVATPLWVSGQTFFSEPVIALCLIAAVLTVLKTTTRGRALSAGVALSVAMAVRLDSLIYLPVFALVIAHDSWPSAQKGRNWSDLGRHLSWFITPLIVLGLAIAIYNLRRFGSPLQTGYGLELGGESTDFTFHRSLGLVIAGLWDLAASSGKGVLWYAPLLLVLPVGIRGWWWRGERRSVLMLLGLCAICWLLHANILIRWLGGWAWGPRFLLPILPLAMLLAGGVWVDVRTGWVTKTALLLVILGVIIQLPAVAVDQHLYLYHLRDTYGSPYIAEDHYIAEPGLSPLIGQWQTALTPATWATPLAWHHWSPALVAGDHQSSAAYRLWWQVLDGEGVSRLIILAAGGLLLLIAMVGVALLVIGCRRWESNPHEVALSGF